MTHLSKAFVPAGMAAAIALCAGNAGGTTVQDLVRVKGHERNVLTGMGIVVGLNGTGDTAKDSLIAARPFAQLLTNLGNPVEDVTELVKADAFAIVNVTMELPATGVREGDRLDVHVDKMFNAESLQGGRLITSMLRPPGPDDPTMVPMAYAEGPVLVQADDPASGVVRGGGQMLADIRTNPVRGGAVTLVLKDQYAGYPVATTIAYAIEQEFAIDGHVDLAIVEDARNIRIFVPLADRARPAGFLAALLTIPIDPSLIQTGARIVVNERAGIITVTGNVEIGPVAITHKGLQLNTITPPPDPAADPAAPPAAPVPQTNGRWVGFDTTGGSSRRATRLADLLNAFDQLNVTTEDQIAIIYELQKTGALHAEIVGQ
ncbi:MAG: hypothetical protein HKN62_09650 [Phycisphaerales bacterium]|nr:hypothetical protein [Phycisphaerales bacterium]